MLLCQIGDINIMRLGNALALNSTHDHAQLGLPDKGPVRNSCDISAFGPTKRFIFTILTTVP